VAGEFLMTDPAHYRVGYEINPWMAPKVWGADPAANATAARHAWQRLKRALEAAGAQVRVIAGEAGQPDMVFPANAAVVLDRKALVARFRHPERAGEAPAFLAAFESLRREGVLDEVAQVRGVFQEGAGDAIWDAGRALIWTGYGPRSDKAAGKVISDYFGRPVAPLELADARYYHLDTCFCPLPGGEVVYWPAAFTPAGVRRIHDIVPGAMLIEATAGDAAAFAVNAVAVGGHVIMARPTPYLRDRIAERGYRVVELDLAPFLLSGGAAFCMTLRLDHMTARAGPVREAAA
jgi:N-dimethylarginine dimethylaminohydrolase